MAVKQPYILARTMKEAHDFARETLGLQYGRYRIVNSPSTIKSVRGVTLYLVPGHEQRFDRFAMKGAIRWTRMDVYDVAERGAPGAEPEPEPDGLVPPGVQQSLDFDDLFSNVGAPAATPPVAEALAPAPEPEPEPQPTLDGGEALEPTPEEPVKKPGRRRRRCKDCGELHYKEDPCSTNPESV